MNEGNGNSNGASAGEMVQLVVVGAPSSKHVKVCMIYRQGLFARTDFSENFVLVFSLRNPEMDQTAVVECGRMFCFTDATCSNQIFA